MDDLDLQDLDAEDLASLGLDLRDLEELYGLTPQKHKKRKWVRPLLYICVVLLGVGCIGGVELMACRFFEPTLYDELMEPVREKGEVLREKAEEVGEKLGDEVRQTASALADRAGAAMNSFQSWLEEVNTPPPEPEPEVEGTTLSQPELAPPKEMLDPLISDIVKREGAEYLTGGGIELVYYNQTDEARSKQMYGTDPLSTHGCGPTAMAMAVSSLTEERVDPEDMARLCVEQGWWCKNHGSYLSLVQGAAELYGLTCESMDPKTLDEDDLYFRLSSGEIAVALMTKGHFTKGGHFILLRGTTLSGEILVADPASRDRSLIPWDLSLILDELSPSRHDGAPLWILSRP